MSEETNKKTNFFKEVLKSVKDLEKYEDFALKLPIEAFKYLFKLILLFTIIITLFYSYKSVNSLTDIYNNLKDKLPEFSYSEGTLKVEAEEPIVIKDYENVLGKIIIDTNQENKTQIHEEEIKDAVLALVLLKDKCEIISKGTSGQVVYSYSDIAKKNNITEFTKQDVINYIESINIVSLYTSIYFAMFIYLFIVYFISILVDVMILAIFTCIAGRIARIKLKFAPAFNIAVHSITLPVLLNLIYIIVNLLTGFYIKYFGIMYNTISYIYVIVAVLMIRTDFINRQLELMKIAEEQEKIKEELKKQKEEEEKKKEEEKKDKEKKKKEKKDKKENDNGLEEGVNPSVIQEKQ